MKLELDGYLYEDSQEIEIIETASNKTVITVSTLRSKFKRETCPGTTRGPVGFYKDADGVYEMVYDTTSVTLNEILDAVKKYKEIMKSKEEVSMVVTTQDKKEQIFNV